MIKSDDRDAHECGGARDLAADRGEFGLGQVDMGRDQSHRGIAGRRDLGRGCRAEAGVAVGRCLRVVQGGAPGRSRRRGGPSDDSSADPRPGPLTRCRVRFATLRRWRTKRQRRPLLSAELLSIGSELTVGETRDTNAGELARALTERGVSVGRLTALPDRLDVVTEAFRSGLQRSDLVISTGGLGPTPDDLTREAIAAALGETPEVDAELEAWLRELWRRRDMPFPEINLKQAWRIPSADALPNPNGTAPGWFVRRPDGRVVVALPGPPREMRPMWTDEVLPRLDAIGLGAEVAVRTYRLTGIGESQLADRLGETLLRADEPGRRDLRAARGGRRPDLRDRRG